jgi:hypothetical protein
MNQLTRCLLYCVLTVCVFCTSNASAQFDYRPTIPPRPQYSMPKSYSGYLANQRQNYHRPSASREQYTVDRYFYHSPNISPYLNLARGPRLGGGGYVNNYYAYVRPEIARRSQAAFMQSPNSRNSNSLGFGSRPIWPCTAEPHEGILEHVIRLFPTLQTPIVAEHRARKLPQSFARAVD